MSHAAYVYDIEHVIVDNLQFMTSYLRYVLTHNAFYFRSFFFFLSLLQAPRWDAQRFWKVQCKKRLGAVERGSVGAYWSSSWYTFSLEASSPTTIVWTDHYQSSVSHQQNGQHELACDFGESTMSVAFFSRRRGSLFTDHVRLILA